MTDFLNREKEFLKLNEELNVRTKILLEKPSNIKEPFVNAHCNSRNSNYFDSASIDSSNRVEELKNSSRRKKPPIKPKYLISKAHTVPRNTRDEINALCRRTVRENEILKRKINYGDPRQPNVPRNGTEKENFASETPNVEPITIRSTTESSRSGITTGRCSELSEIYKNENYKGSSLESVQTELPKTGNEDKQTNSSLKKSSSQVNNFQEKVVTKKNLSSDGLIKFLKSKVAILQDELETSVKDLTKKSEELVINLAAQKKMETQRDKAIARNNNLTAQISKLEETLAECVQKMKDKELECSSVNREMEAMKREMRLMTQTNANLEKRLYRANEELENVKNSLTSLRDADRELQETALKDKETYEKQIKSLRKQRADLLSGFKQQMFLLDNLKRRNICLEQARLITFAEKEFTKVLEWNTKE